VRERFLLLWLAGSYGPVTNFKFTSPSTIWNVLIQVG